MLAQTAIDTEEDAELRSLATNQCGLSFTGPIRSSYFKMNFNSQQIFDAGPWKESGPREPLRPPYPSRGAAAVIRRTMIPPE